MRKTNKKGFTIVELVIVIAVVAILAAVLIPTFVSVTKRANESKDTQLVRNLNTALAVDTEVGKHETMQSALEAAAKAGYDVAKINTSATDNEILWDSKNDCFVYKKDSGIEYIPNSVSEEQQKAVKNYQYWVIASTPNAIYSTYLYDYKGNGTETVTTGLDVGNETVAAITYKNDTANAQEVVIRTNSFDTAVAVNAEKDTVSHYGKVKEVNIAKVAPSSYHEYGNVAGNINLAYGRVELKANSSVSNVVIKTIENVTPTSDNVKISVETGANANLIISEVSGVSAVVDGSGASTVAKIENISGKVAAIGSEMYDSIQEAWTNIKNNDTLVLLNDCSTTEILFVPANVKVVVDLNKHNISSTKRVFYVSKENSSLEIKGEGKISTTEQTVFGMVGSETDDGKTYALKVGHNVEISSSIYGIAIFDRNSSRASYGVDLTFEGHDSSEEGSIYISGNINKKVGNVPIIKVENAVCDSTVYLAGFSKFYATDSSFKLTGSLMIKSGEIHLSNNNFVVDCESINKLEADYVKNGNGAFGAKCGILFENGVEHYAGLTSVSITVDNKFEFINTNGMEYTDVIFIDYTESASVEIDIKVRYLSINEFKYRIEYRGVTNKNIDCSGYIYFINEENANAYTVDKFKEQYGIKEVTVFGNVEKIN